MIDASKRKQLRRLRLLQWLQHADGEWLAAPLLLKLLLDDPDLRPELVNVLRSLIWLEDQGLADVKVVDGLDDESTTFARITEWGNDFLSADMAFVEGIFHPNCGECLEVSADA
ncbi:hypothetical protein FHP88_15655 [Sedimenticola selenatireducens]|uniref:Uncharacterized protein n=1 Tax=Sedimenticola selenatireducens TaxID=191960 RepID=A0A557S0L2_9GAMM|nr:hypothetical protein [Sedimenticola selenatireducens]TVO70888.1 hypothetical protein FHP88_15655 [Sedimenticola selenatireducens]